METLDNNAQVNHNDLVADVALILDGRSVIEQRTHHINEKGTMYLEDNLLVFLLDGSFKVTYGKQSFQANKNDMLLLNKATLISTKVPVTLRTIIYSIV